MMIMKIMVMIMVMKLQICMIVMLLSTYVPVFSGTVYINNESIPEE